MRNSKFIIRLLSLVLFTIALATPPAFARYDITRTDFDKNTFVGPSIVNREKVPEWNSLPEVPQNATPEQREKIEKEREEVIKHQTERLFTTLIDLTTLGIPLFKIPDLLYPVEYGEDGEPSEASTAMGLNLVPIGTGEPIYRIRDDVRAKLEADLDRQSPEDRQRIQQILLERAVDAQTFQNVARIVANQRQADAPKIKIEQFDDSSTIGPDGEPVVVPGIASEVKKQLATDLESFHEEAYLKVTKALRDRIAQLQGGFDEKWIETEFDNVLKDTGLSDRLSDEQVAAVMAKQKISLRESYGDQFKESVFDRMAQAYSDEVKRVQAVSEEAEINLNDLATYIRTWCRDAANFPENPDRQACQSYSYYLRWDLQNKLPKSYARDTIQYTYTQVVATKRFDENAYWDAVWSMQNEVRENNPKDIGVRVVDRLVRQSMWDDAGIEDTRHMYAIVGHTSAHEAIFKDLKELTSTKVQTSIHHVSAYYGANGYTRRGFLSGGEPNNLYTVALKGVDQQALNLNAKIWAKLYYENPNDHYQFAEEYEFDEFENTTLRRVLDFAHGWLDKEDAAKGIKGWINRPLNARYLEYAEKVGLELSEEEKTERKNMSYYRWLQDDPVFGLYCFEGVTNQLNVALNVPLTEKYLQRIYGEEAGTKLFAYANYRWQKILINEGYPGAIVEGTDTGQSAVFTGEVTNFDLNKLAVILDRFIPLWELKGMLTNPGQYTPSNPLAPDLDESGKVVGYASNPLRDKEYNMVGNSLAWVPQTTADILADLIEMYVPFHKTKAYLSSSIILNFQAEHERRTGISKDTYMGAALPIISKMFKAEASIVLSALYKDNPSATPEQAKAALDDYVAKNEGALRKVLSKKPEDGPAPSEEEVEKKLRFLMEGLIIPNPANQIVKVVPGIKAGVYGYKDVGDVAVPGAAPYTASMVQAARGDVRYAAWKVFKKEAKAILRVANKTPVQVQDAVLARLQDQRFVKFYTRPGLLQSMVAGSWPTNPHVLLRGVGTVINEEWTIPNPDRPAEDLTTYNYLEKEPFVKALAKQTKKFIDTPVTEAALEAWSEQLYDGSVIGIGDETSSNAQLRVRRVLEENAR